MWPWSLPYEDGLRNKLRRGVEVVEGTPVTEAYKAPFKFTGKVAAG